MKTGKILSILLVLVTAVIITACYKNKDDTNNNTPSTFNIMMKNSVFSPASLTVVAGSTVTWQNDDNIIHTVTGTDGIFNSGDIAVGSTYSRTFSTVGTFNYHDEHNTNMTGVVRVTERSSGGGGGGY